MVHFRMPRLIFSIRLVVLFGVIIEFFDILNTLQCFFIKLGVDAFSDEVVERNPEGIGNNEAERPLEVVGSAAAGERRGVGTNLPIGKGAKTRSDIDYVAPPSSLPYLQELQGKLPSLDFKTGIVPGTGNPYMDPIIRFEPGAKPTVIPRQQ